MSTATSSRIRAACPCGKKYIVDAKFAGKRGKCKCGEFFEVPMIQNATLKNQCRSCGVTLGTPRTFCKKCERKAALVEAKSTANVNQSETAVSLGRTIGVVIVCALVVIVSVIFHVNLRASGFVSFFALLGLVAAASIISARLIGSTKKFVQELMIAVLVSYGIVALSRGFVVYFNLRSHEVPELYLLVAVLGPLAVWVIAFLDRILEEVHKADSSVSSQHWWDDPKVRLVGGCAAAAMLVAGICQTQLDGPGFLSFYFSVGVGICVALLIARLTSCPIIALLTLPLAFEAIGAIRYGYGLSQGMHRFGMLQKMMLVGPIGIVVIPFLDRILTSTGGGSSWGGSCGSSSSCGSSCGGGGCGGGGCGGCGG